ncbi:MAG: AMP-binding protein [Rhodobacteraceae bacterium]|nr:AMP-binding protein [Paracoccaceae bacterium]
MNRRLIKDWSDWATMRSDFRWPRPERFNIAQACCDGWAGQVPDKVALTHVSADGSVKDWTYGQLKEASDRLANAFAARGVGQGDRVAVLLQQGPEVLLTHFATQKLGAVVLPLFTLFGSDALAYRLADSGAKLAVTDGDNLEKLLALRPDLPDLQEVYCTGPAQAPVRAFWDEIAAASPSLTPVDTLAEDPAVMIYTSGTTGQPKGVLHAHRFLIGHLPSLETHHEYFPQPGDKGWTPADWAWIGGLMDMAMPCLYYGVPLVSRRMRKFDPDEAFRLIADHQIRNLFLPPTALKLMRQASVPGAVDIRSIGSGGESLGADLLEWGRSALGAPINEIYGQTECNLVLASVQGAMEIRPGSMGQAVPGHEVAVLDAEGRTCAPGEMGEICVKAPDPVMFLEYWGKPDKTAEKLRDGWLRTGDLATRDADGYFTFASRDDDVITSAGYRIGPTEIENCLSGHADVVMAAAVGVPDPVRTEIVKAFVVLRNGAEWSDALRDALITRVRERVSPHVAPRLIEPIAEMPMTATGKIMRRELRGV